MFFAPSIAEVRDTPLVVCTLLEEEEEEELFRASTTTTTTITEGSTPRFRLIRICNPKMFYSVLSLSLIQAFLCFCLLASFSVRLDG